MAATARIADRYELGEELGRGGMGVVHAAFDTKLGRHVAIKTLLDASREANARARLEREARSAARIASPYIAQVYDVLTEGDAVYIVMERLYGTSLEARIKEAPLSADDALLVAGEICQALAAAHAAGIIHRDVKPANVHVVTGQSVRAKLIDFGIARVAEPSEWSSAAHVVGTPTYMSPEQSSGRDVDARTDIFSLGVTLYRALTQRYPWDGRDVPYAIAVRACPPHELHSLRPDLPRTVCNVVMRAIEKERDDRYNSARELGEALDAARRSLAAREEADSPVIATPVIADAASDVGGAPEPRRHPLPGIRRSIAAIVAAAIATAVVCGFAAMGVASAVRTSRMNAVALPPASLPTPASVAEVSRPAPASTPRAITAPDAGIAESPAKPAPVGSGAVSTPRRDEQPRPATTPGPRGKDGNPRVL